MRRSGASWSPRGRKPRPAAPAATRVRSRGGRRRWAPACAALLGVGLYLLRRKAGFGQPSPWLAWRSDPFSRWLRAFFPALSQAELGEGGKVGLSVLAFALVAMLPLLFSIGIVAPGGRRPSCGALPWVLFVLGLLVYVGLCVRSELGEGE